MPPSPAVAVHGLPAVRQAVLSATHLPPEQLPPQQADESVQAWPSAVQLAALEQVPFVVSHCRLQQSVATAQELPAPLQVLTDEAQVLATKSHEPEQHCAFVVHATPTTPQLTPTPPVLPEPPCPVDAPLPPVPVLITLVELFPQLGRANSAASSSAKIAAMDRVVAEGLLILG
jgi:hypothetical protein